MDCQEYRPFLPLFGQTSRRMRISSSEVFNWVSRAFEDPAPELNWETKHTRKSSTWTAITPEGDRYAVSSRDTSRLASVTFTERGAPRTARAQRIASTDTFELGAVCAQHHYFRLTNSREVDLREDADQ